jgi:hypothetical protein
VLAQQIVAQGVHRSRATSSDTHWSTWVQFCADLQVDPTLADVRDPVPVLQVFALRYRTGTCSPSKLPVRSRTVEDALRSVGQTFACLGSPDPRLSSPGHVDHRLKRMLQAFHKQDPPPHRVKPLPLPIIQHIAATAHASTDVALQAIADMIILAFFFLLRPGEYTGASPDAQPFRLCDIALSVGNTKLDLASASDSSLFGATFVTLEFTTQKNGVRGEVIGLGRSGDPLCCPVLAAARRLVHLRRHSAPPTTPLASYCPRPAALAAVSPSAITTALRLATTLLGRQYGFTPNDVSARSLRAAGATALLCADVDPNIIQLLGRWRSDEMLRYLHLQAEPLMRNFAPSMLRGGHYRLHPNHSVPSL